MVETILKKMIATGCISIAGTLNMCPQEGKCYLMEKSVGPMFVSGFNDFSFAANDKEKLKNLQSEIEQLKKKIAHDESCEKLGLELMGRLK